MCVCVCTCVYVCVHICEKGLVIFLFSFYQYQRSKASISKDFLNMRDKRTNLRMDKRTNGWMDGQTDPLLEMRGRI